MAGKPLLTIHRKRALGAEARMSDVSDEEVMKRVIWQLPAAFSGHMSMPLVNDTPEHSGCQGNRFRFKFKFRFRMPGKQIRLQIQIQIQDARKNMRREEEVTPTTCDFAGATGQDPRGGALCHVRLLRGRAHRGGADSGGEGVVTPGVQAAGASTPHQRRPRCVRRAPHGH
eukprot:1190856-Prorocentrum_minimum.AAC.3